ncbi:uncharacterized protein JCM10292_000194 [Rhodotorula paludigena]|uniref:uncharacterized protein n=1 Tax=Rhodotorula paludigena TaxID=86838 RepID=UPI00317EE944
MNLRKAITVLVILIALVLTGTVVVLTTVVQYFGIDSRDVITEPEMRLAERLAAADRASDAPEAGKDQKVIVGHRETSSATAGEAAPVGARADGEAAAVQSGDAVQGGGDDAVEHLMNRLDERGWFANSSDVDASPTPMLRERIPKIIHATWKTDIVPKRWADVRQGCQDLHPDYEFKLWSDAASRQFIAEEYPWFLSTFDSYTYPIQRADSIRYFVLHHYGGIYMDLDIGCRRNLDPLRYFQVILPQTIPVGVSNDLMIAEKGHPFMDLVIHNLITFDHTYGTNYPTVMFSTGPMFVSAVYGMWPKDLDEGVERQVRVLPRRWYGKNAPLSEMEESYFDHFYGSSWHADDAGFITFLGRFGMVLMYAGLGIVVLGVVRLVWNRRIGFKATPRSIGPIALPYEALPFARPGTPGSRPGSPHGSRPGTPAGGRFRRAGDPKPGPGGLFYMPVWLYPSGEQRPEAGPRGGDESQGSWSQYFSNLSFVNEETGSTHHYSPVPNFSRPPSPSNNSILHAPGSMHDGAFDGTPLHSIPAPKAVRPFSSAPSASRAPDERTSPSPPPPASPNPPAYSALRSWGTSVFRGGVANPFLFGPSSSSSSGDGPLLPLANPASLPASSQRAPSPALARPDPRRASSPSAATAGRTTPRVDIVVEDKRGGADDLARAPSPHPPPQYALAVDAPVALVDARSGPPRAGREHGFEPREPVSPRSPGRGPVPSPSPGFDGRRDPSAATAAEEAGHGAVVERTADAPDAAARGRGAAAAGATDEVEDEVEPAVAAWDAEAPGVEGVAVEEEVDRLLSEMAPEDYQEKQ